MITQDDIREKLLEKRKLTPKKIINQHAKAFLEQILKADIIKLKHKLGIYLSQKGEMDLTPLVNYCWQHNIKCYLPVLDPANAGHLMFTRYTEDSEMKKNKFKIPEPVCNADDLLSPHKLDMVFLPLVAYDLLGHRIGMGKGFYDKTFDFHHKMQSPYLIGCAHEFQQAHSIHPNSWDIPLDAVITENRLVVFR